MSIRACSNSSTVGGYSTEARQLMDITPFLSMYMDDYGYIPPLVYG
jgi:hypothetical protein